MFTSSRIRIASIAAAALALAVPTGCGLDQPVAASVEDLARAKEERAKTLGVEEITPPPKAQRGNRR